MDFLPHPDIGEGGMCRGRSDGALIFFGSGPHTTLMTSFSRSLLETLPPNTVTLGVRASTWKFGQGHTVQFIAGGKTFESSEQSRSMISLNDHGAENGQQN